MNPGKPATVTANIVNRLKQFFPHRKSKPSEMTILEHLAEARKRLLWSALGVLVATVVGWFLYDRIIMEITAPLQNRTPLIFTFFGLSLPEHGLHCLALNFTTVAGAFDLKIKIALWTGIILSSPWWILQGWLYLAPGLYKREKRYVLCFGVGALLLFLLGVLTGMWVAPQAVVILADFTPPGATSFISANSYFSFYMTLVLFFGITTLIPEVLVALNFIGLLSAKKLLRGWRIAVIGAFTFAAITNPIPNPTPMIIQGLLLSLLYLLAVGISALHDYLVQKRLLKSPQGI